ncbi:MAG: glycosyltransferase family 4 protein [Reyranellaceae bacterium]
MERREIWQLVDARDIGGIERHIGELVGALGARGVACRAVLYQRYTPSPLLDLLRREGIPHLELDGSPRTLLAALRQHRPALLHTHGYKAGIVGRPCARLLGIPVVSSFHAGETGPWPLWFYQAIDEWTSVLASRIAVSSSIAARLPWKSTLVENFVRLPELPARAERRLRVAFVGRLSTEKGPDVFCQIAETVGPCVEWDIYGDGALRDALKGCAPPFVRFHGFVPDMNDVWPQVDLLLMPSRAEGLPMAALEALSRGIPVAASAVGGLPDLLGADAGRWLFPASDVGRAASVVDAFRYLTDRERAELRGKLRDVIRHRFSPDAVLPKVLDVYREAGWSCEASSSTNVQSSMASGAN